MKARIRKAAPGDLERIVEMGMRFVAETDYHELIQVRPEKLAETVLSIVKNPDGVVLVSESEDQVTGMIALVAFDHPYSGTRTASEAVWWVDPEHRGVGLRLLQAAEGWAKEKGAKAMVMVAPNEAIGRLYMRLGYKPIETSYQRRL